MQWFYADDSDQQHEVDEETLAELVGGGTVRSDTLVWNETMPDWQSCSSVRPELFGGNALPPALSHAQKKQITSAEPGQLYYRAPVDAVAVCSLVFGGLGLLCFQGFGLVGVICGHIAYKRAKEDPSQSTNRGLAIGGLVTGYLSILILVAIIVFYGVMIGVGIASGEFDP